MNDTINAILAAVMLGILLAQLANQRPDRGGAWNARSAARALVGVYLLGVAIQPFAGAPPEGAQTALLVGLTILLLVRWRRRSETGQ